MAVKIRMTRMGRRHRPFFRINAVESRNPRDGRVIEKLGHYDPLEKDQTKQVVLNKERIQYWLDQGAIASETVAEIIAKHGIKSKHAEARAARRAKARELAAKQGKLFNKTQRIEAQKATEAEAEKAKADAEAAQKAEEEKAKAKEEAAKAKEEAAKKAEEEKAAAEEAKKAEAEKAKAEAEEAQKAEETKAEPEAKEEKAEPAEEKAEAKAEPEAKEKPAEAEAAEESEAKEDEDKAKE